MIVNFRKTVEIVQHFKFLRSAKYNNLKWQLNVDTFVQKNAAVAVLSMKMVWFDHTDHAHLLQSCNQECPDIFNLSMAWFYHSEEKSQIELNYKNWFHNNRQRPPQS